MENFKEPYDKEQCVSGMYPHCLICSHMCAQRAVDFAERRKQEQHPEGRLVRFYKEDKKWYADVPNHTKEENEMVCGADTMLEMLAEGNSEITLLITEFAIPGTDPIYCRIHEHDEDGAWYNVWGEYGTKEYGQIWLCNVMHDVTNEHPEEFCVYRLNHELACKIAQEKKLASDNPSIPAEEVTNHTNYTI